MGKSFLDTDIESLLDDINVDYQVSGKNISRHCIGLSCPFCGDTSTHLGVFKENKNYSCFICGSKGSLPKLIKELTQDNWGNVFKLIQSHSKGFVSVLPTETYERPKSFNIEAVKGIKQGLGKLHRSYLLSRGLNPDYFGEKYQLMSGTEIGPYKHRLIIPIHKQREIVSFISRDITGRSDLRYKNLPDSKSIVPVKETVYNLDNVGDTAIIAEGVFDVWSFDPYGIGLFGTQYTYVQLYEIFKKQFQKLIICLDPKEEKIATKLAFDLSSFVPEIKICIIQSGEDPAEAASSEIIDVKKELL